MRVPLPVLICHALLAAAPVRAQTPASINTLTPDERQAGWQLLFDGRTVDGWRGYMREDMPSGWQVVDGLFTRVAQAGDIITTRKFRDFDLKFDFLVAEGGNSGIFYRAVEGPEFIYYFAPEYQILDDERHPDGRSPLTSTGANYAVNEAPRGVTKPAGQWNSGRILVKGQHVEHWLNGQKVVEYELGSEDWARRVAASKFKQWPEYGKAAEGYIGIQDHGSRVAYRNIRIREIRP
jgi:3-keto-disaccharide hydrolase